jgi:hypothetical protein
MGNLVGEVVQGAGCACGCIAVYPRITNGVGALRKPRGDERIGQCIRERFFIQGLAIDSRINSAACLVVGDVLEQLVTKGGCSLRGADAVGARRCGAALAIEHARATQLVQSPCRHHRRQQPLDALLTAKLGQRFAHITAVIDHGYCGLGRKADEGDLLGCELRTFKGRAVAHLHVDVQALEGVLVGYYLLR